MDTKRSLYEIEYNIAKSRYFDYLKHLIVFNVYGTSGVLPIWHECDVLVCSKSGYLTEIEIKRSFSDFLNDFKKEHDHKSKYIKNFYYCIPEKIKDKVVSFLDNFENRTDWRTKAGILIFYEDNNYIDILRLPTENDKCVKLSIEQMLYLARLGSMRVVALKKKFIKTEERIKELNAIISDLEEKNEEKFDKLVIDI